MEENNIKKIIFIITLSVIFLFSEKSKAQEIIDEGECGVNLKWVITDDGVITISGSGDMFDYEYNNPYGTTAPWGVHHNLYSTIIIEEGVTGIGGFAFSSCYNLTGILSLPESIKSIGDHAFQSCYFIGSLTLPEGITYLGGYAFYECRGFIGSLSLPIGLTSIGDYAFSGCSGFNGNLILPMCLENIGSYAFWGCYNFKGVINHSIEPQMIEHNVFLGLQIKNITLYVPFNSVEKYKNSPVWQDFGSIVAIESSIKENEFPSFSIYPNPAYNILNLLREKTGKARIEIYKISGSLIKEIEIYEINTEIDIFALEAGVYIIRLIDEISSSAQRFIVGF